MHGITPGNAEYSHDSDDSWIDGDYSGFHLFQYDAHYRQQDDAYVQLIPPTKQNIRQHRAAAAAAAAAAAESTASSPLGTAEIYFLILLSSIVQNDATKAAT